MLDLFAELASRRVSGCAEDGRWRGHWQPACPRALRRSQAAGVSSTERSPPSTAEWPGDAPEALLGLWTELAWRHCHAVRGREGPHDPDEYPAHPA